MDKLQEEKMSFNYAEEVLKISNINVLSKKIIIIYMVKVPLTTNVTFKKILLRPIRKKNNIVINIEFNEILKSKNVTYGFENHLKYLYVIEII